MSASHNGFAKNPFVVVPFAFVGTDVRTMSNDVVEGIRIGEKPPLDVGIGAGGDEYVPKGAPSGVRYPGLHPPEGRAVSVDGDDQQVGSLLDGFSHLGDLLIGLELVDGPGVSAAAGSDLKRDGETFFPTDPNEQRFQQLLVRAVLRENFHLYTSFHRISTRR